MVYSIIPDFNNMESTIEMINKYYVNLEYNDFCNPDIYDDEAEIEKRVAFYKGLGRDMSQDTMHGAFLGLDLAAADSVIRERSKQLYRQSLEIAKQLGIKGVVFHTGLIGSLRLKDYLLNWLDKSVSFWSDMCSEFSMLNIYIENSFEQEPDILVRFMEAMKDVKNCHICFDYGHAILTPTPIEEWVSKLAPYIGHMHLNDNDLRDDLHLVPGTGKIDFTYWKKLMMDNDIEVPVLLELLGNDNIRKALDYMAGICQ